MKKSIDFQISQPFSLGVETGHPEVDLDAANRAIEGRTNLYDTIWYVHHCTSNVIENPFLS